MLESRYLLTEKSCLAQAIRSEGSVRFSHTRFLTCTDAKLEYLFRVTSVKLRNVGLNMVASACVQSTHAQIWTGVLS